MILPPLSFLQFRRSTPDAAGLYNLRILDLGMSWSFEYGAQASTNLELDYAFSWTLSFEHSSQDLQLRFGPPVRSRGLNPTGMASGTQIVGRAGLP